MPVILDSLFVLVVVGLFVVLVYRRLKRNSRFQSVVDDIVSDVPASDAVANIDKARRDLDRAALAVDSDIQKNTKLSESINAARGNSPDQPRRFA